MLRPGIKSRPVYGKLSPQPGVAHVFVVDAEGAAAVVDMAASCPPGFFATATIFHIARAADATRLQALRDLGAPVLVTGASFGDIAPKLGNVLADARMGTRLYTAGTEGVMGQTIALALGCGLEFGAIVTEHRGSAARRVQCVHCKAFTEDVTTQPARCAGCGLTLLVRDHYSYRLAAFQGVCIDAEEPGSAPPAEEMFPLSEKAPRIAVIVAGIEEVTPLVKRFTLVSKSGEPLPTFAGGAHIAVEMHDGDVLHRNSYSLMSAPDDPSHYAISVRRDESGRGGSLFLHRKVEEGQELSIGHPVNLFPIDRRARRHLLIAGGIGITPFMAMVAHFERDHCDFELHYAAKSQDQAAFAAVLEARFAAAFRLYRSDLGERLAIRELLSQQPIGTHLYVCGPTRLIEEVTALASELGWPPQAVHFEHFLAPATGEPYDLYLKASDKRIHVGSHQSMLEAIEAAGIEAPFLCRGGACGQCETGVVACDGRLLHHDHFLSDDDKASGRKVMPCVSRFEGRLLTLDR